VKRNAIIAVRPTIMSIQFNLIRIGWNQIRTKAERSYLYPKTLEQRTERSHEQSWEIFQSSSRGFWAIHAG